MVTFNITTIGKSMERKRERERNNGISYAFIKCKEGKKKAERKKREKGQPACMRVAYCELLVLACALRVKVQTLLMMIIDK